MPMTRKEKATLGVVGGLAALLAMLGLSTSGGKGTDSIPGTPTGPKPAKPDLPPPPGPGNQPGPGPGGLSGGPQPEGVKFDPGQHEGSYPTPGKMYQVRKDDIFGGEYSNRSIAYRALLSKAYAVAIADGMTDDQAKQFARTIAKSGARRAQYIDAITCVGMNDAAFATWGYGPKARPGPQGRAIRLLKYHADNRQRLLEGRALVRNIKQGDYMTPGDKSGTPIDPELAESFEFLFLPDLDAQSLLNGDIVVTGWDPPFDWTIDMPEDMANQIYGCGDGEVLLS